jgi:UDP-N-acetylmuramoyl-tripeptide--D-alanyl-D-alanine ligase
VKVVLATPPRLNAPTNTTAGLAIGMLKIRPTDRRAVFEVGIDGPGQMAGYARMLRSAIVVVTSIGSEHQRSFHSLETTRHEKAEILRALGPDGLAVINGDDPHVRWMGGQTRARVVTCGLGPNNDVWATDVALNWPLGLRCTLHLEGQSFPLQTRLLGKHQLFSLLAAVTVGRAEGLSLEQVLERVALVEPTRGRLQPVQLASGAILLRDDFKGALETYDSALDLLAEIPAARRFAALGNVSEPPGSQGPIYRRLGARLAGICSQVVVVGTQHQAYAAGAVRAGLAREAIVSVGRDPLAAAELLRGQLKAGDVVLIKGRDNQRMERIALVLAGHTVHCNLARCHMPVSIQCERCPVVSRGWSQPAERALLLGRLGLGSEVTR